MNKPDKRILDLIKSGNFTVMCWDNGRSSFYEGKQTIETINEKELEPFIEFDCDFDGYLDNAMKLLINALGGHSGSI